MEFARKKEEAGVGNGFIKFSKNALRDFADL